MGILMSKMGIKPFFWGSSSVWFRCTCDYFG